MYLLFITLLQTSKAIAFNYETFKWLPAVCLVAQLMHLVLSHRLGRVQIQLTQAELFVESAGKEGVIPFKRPEEEEDAELSYFELFKVLKPYFYPKGWLNKLRCVLTYGYVCLYFMGNVVLL
jgi:hypothetical protein